MSAPMLITSVTKIVPPHLEAWLNGAPMSMPYQMPCHLTPVTKPTPPRIGTTRATDCHQPALRIERPSCLQQVAASPAPEPEPPTPKPPKSITPTIPLWERKRDDVADRPALGKPFKEPELSTQMSDIERARIARAQRYLTVRSMRGMAAA